MTKNLLKKILIGGLIVGAGLSLGSCKKYEINGNRVNYNLITDNIIEYSGNNKIKYISSASSTNTMTSVKINGRGYRTGIVYNEAEKKFDYIKKQMGLMDESRDKAKKEKDIEKNKRHLEEDLEVLKGKEIK